MDGLPDLSDQSVLITGASGGLGLVLAETFARAGARVACHARSRIAAEETAERVRRVAFADGAVHAVCGLLDKTGSDIVDSAYEALGDLTGVINNAGIQPVVEFSSLDAQQWQRMFDTNLASVHEVTRSASSRMARGAWITHIASIEGVRPAFGHTHYAAAKAGLIMHAKAAALELGPRGIRVNAVSPGLIERDGIEEQWAEGVKNWKAHAPLGKLVPPEHVAWACTMLASPFAGSITGHNLVVDAGMLTTPGW